MPDGSDSIEIKAFSRIADIPADQWDACAGDDNPFTSHAFLSALEDSGSATAESGWMPQHLGIHDDTTGHLMAAAPLYLKNHSYGEYIFDWSWADAYERAGGSYFPKLLSAVPFTPASGRRLLLHPDAPPKLFDVLAGGMVQLAQQVGVSSVHINFTTEDEWNRLGSSGLLQRVGQQFHWENRDYQTFDDFLGALSSRKRKAIRKERRAAAEHGLRIRALSGDDIEERHWDSFFHFYHNTSDRKWGSAYLNREFFSLLGERLADKVVLVTVEDGDEPVAAALNLRGRDTLFGRNWGCSERYKFLHFEACYYQAIDYAIEHGLRWVEAGAQGPHKVQRGYLPQKIYSLHWIADGNFRQAVAHFLDEERQAIEEDMVEIAAASPYRKDVSSTTG